ncbi:aminotransferase class IV [Micromonospora lupini]|uniref:aminotransferase class IV n=1 Tax=Micromonospora lupini TaxID=285679 RepID=UPI00224E631B|nr:aminotransferase class IV [Micromonospora lupini]MCX5064316.1 aminotransferase class IV [Micromonospora lupini]
MDRLVAVFGIGLVDPAAPIVHADDPGLLRGDGAFEAWLLAGGEPVLLPAHLNRLSRSALSLALPLPKLDALRTFVLDVAAAWPRDVEAVQRLVCTRGRAGTAKPTIFTTVEPVPAWTSVNRKRGLRLVTGTVGFPVGERAKAPWLLGGVKSLSYAVHTASQRWASSRGAQEMLWLSSDGYALECPSFNLVWIRSSTMFTVPGWSGIIAGTTSGALIGQAATLGLGTDEALVTPDELAHADGVWLTGSLSGILAATEIDGRPLTPSPLLGEARRLIGYPEI